MKIQSFLLVVLSMSGIIFSQMFFVRVLIYFQFIIIHKNGFLAPFHATQPENIIFPDCLLKTTIFFCTFSGSLLHNHNCFVDIEVYYYYYYFTILLIEKRLTSVYIVLTSISNLQ